jgi:beta-phosphoglucomutase
LLECGDEPRLPACPIGAFIFDVDGVLADTAAIHTAAWQRLAEEEGLEFNDPTADALRGLSREDSLRRLLDGRSVSPDQFSELLDRKNGYYLSSLKHLNERVVLPGVRLLLAGLRELGIKLAAASLSRNARPVLLRTGLVSNFDVIIDGNDLADSKSGLNRFLLLARAVRVEPARCVVVEDSTAGIAAARAAGMRSVGVGGYDRLCAATMVLDSLRGVDAGTLVYWLGHRNHP